MNCGCTKHIGCFAYGDEIDFGMTAPSSGEYTFEIFGNSGFQSINVNFIGGDQLILPFEFNENSATIIKIKFPPEFVDSAINYATTADGACSFEVVGISSICNS